MDQEDLRISDAERDGTIAHLRQACTDGRITLEEFTERLDLVLSARTRGQLEEVTRDLPATVSTSSVQVQRRQPTHWTVAVMSENKRTTRWRADESTNAVAVMGSCKLDLRSAEMPAGELIINAFAVMGEVKVIVPEGVQVELEGLAIMGSKECKIPPEEMFPEAPIVRVRGYAVMGSVVVVSEELSWADDMGDKFLQFQERIAEKRYRQEERRRLREERRAARRSRHHNW